MKNKRIKHICDSETCINNLRAEYESEKEHVCQVRNLYKYKKDKRGRPEPYTIADFARLKNVNANTLRRCFSEKGSNRHPSHLCSDTVTENEPEIDMLMRVIPVHKIGICQKPDCDNDFIRWTWNRKYCDKHSRHIRRNK